MDPLAGLEVIGRTRVVAGVARLRRMIDRLARTGVMIKHTGLRVDRCDTPGRVAVGAAVGGQPARVRRIRHLATPGRPR